MTRTSTKRSYGYHSERHTGGLHFARSCTLPLAFSVRYRIISAYFPCNLNWLDQSLTPQSACGSNCLLLVLQPTKWGRSCSNENALFRTPTLAGSNNQENIASDVSVNDTVDFRIVICHAMPCTVVYMKTPCAGSSACSYTLGSAIVMLGCFSDVMDMDSYIEALLWISGRSLCQQTYLSQSYHLPKADDTTGGRPTHDRSLKGPEGYIPFPSKSLSYIPKKVLEAKIVPISKPFSCKH